MRFTSLLAALWALSYAPLSGAAEISCPGRLDVAESAANADSSWSLVLDEGRRGYFLDSVSVYSGHPGSLANLVPDRTVVTKRERRYIWNLHSSEPEGYWVACSYTNSRLMLTKALPAGLKRCELTEKLLPSGARLGIERFDCQ